MSIKKLVEEREKYVFDVSWHPSGNYIAIVGANGVLNIFKRSMDDNFSLLDSVEKKRTLRRVEFDQKGERLTVAGFDSTITLYEFREKEPKPLKVIAEFKDQTAEIKSARFSSSGRYIVSAARDKTIYIWDIKDNDYIVHNEHTQDVKDCRFSPDDKVVVSVSFDGLVKVWDPNHEFGSLQTFNRHTNTVWSLNFNPKNNDLVTVGEDGKAILYKRKDDIYVVEREISLQKNLECLYTVCYTNNHWVIAGSRTVIFIVDENFNKVVKEVKVDQTGDINCVAPDPKNNNVLAVGNDDGTVVLIDINL